MSKGRGVVWRFFCNKVVIVIYCMSSVYAAYSKSISHIPLSCRICFLWEWREGKTLTYEAICYNCLRFV